MPGFGNLAGHVEFWDRNKQALVGKAYLPCTTIFSWSGCSHYFMAATTFPRLRVDNVIRVVRFDGMKIHEHTYGTQPFFQACFRPAPRGTYADPRFTADEMVGGPVVPVSNSSQAANGASGEPNKAGVYRPPGNRGAAPSFKLNEDQKAGTVDKASFLSRAAAVQSGVRKTELTSGSSDVSSFGSSKKFVPGMDPDLVKPRPIEGISCTEEEEGTSGGCKSCCGGGFWRDHWQRC